MEMSFGMTALRTRTSLHDPYLQGAGGKKKKEKKELL